MRVVRSIVYACDGRVSAGACLRDSGTFSHTFRRGAPSWDGRALFGCVRVTSRGIEDGCAGVGSSTPTRRLGALVALRFTDGTGRTFTEGTSVWTDARGARLLVVDDGGRANPHGRGAGYRYYHNPTCDECRAARPWVDRLAQIVSVEKIDVTKSPERALRDGVRGVPTLLGPRGARILDVRTFARTLLSCVSATRDRRALRKNPEGAATVRKRVAAWLSKVSD